MAFDGNNPHLKSVLQETRAETITPEATVTKETFISSIIPDKERKKTYTFTMRPSIRQKLDRIVKKKGFRSSSEFLEALIDNL